MYIYIYIYIQTGKKCGSNAGSACFSSKWGAWPFHFKFNQKLFFPEQMFDFPGVNGFFPSARSFILISATMQRCLWRSWRMCRS